MNNYVNYHKHSSYTNVRISDSAVLQEAYAMRAVELGQKVLSSCEHGWQGDAFQTVKLARKYGLKPLISAEAYFVKDRFEKDRSNCHIFIGAKNENGRQALNDVLSEANLTGFYGQPRLDIPLILSLPREDVIVTTACIGGVWKYEDAEDIIKMFAEHFKYFYLEVQYHNVDTQIELNKKILELKDKLNIPIIMGCDSHYIYPNQSQDRTDYINSKGIKHPGEENWFLDYPDVDTAYERFANQCVLSHEEICEAINNTNIFEEIEEYNSPVFNDELKMPTLYPNLTQEDRDEEYKKLVWQGWDRYKVDIPEEKWQEYINEINKEISIVVNTKMSDYFICNYYIIEKGKQNGGKLTKSGRGSGASFFTNTLLGFSDTDRISSTVHMYPERFMSETRILQAKICPDIDFNEAPTEPFVRAQAEILGQQHSYPMIAYGTLKKSAAWKLYAKSQGIPFEIANTVSEQIKKYENAVKRASEDEKDDIDINDYINKEFKEIFSKSKDYLGLISSWSIAPCSSLVYMSDIRKEIGLVKIKDNICCLLDGHAAEEGHFLKNDHLKVSVVDLIYKAYARIGLEPPKVKQLLDMCPPEDDVWKIYSNGCTLGINQCEQTGTSSRVGVYQPKNISELSAFVAAIRPGFKSLYKTFEKRIPFAYDVKSFDNLIQTKEMPNSFLFYQEQIMAALNYAGIEMAECYAAIKNIAKKRAEKVLAYKETFLKGFSESIRRDENRSEEESMELAKKLWQVVEDSAGYSFNASHSYCVALDSLYCAWLKAHHPIEFYEVAITLSEQSGDKDKMLAYKQEAEDYFNITFPPYKFGQDNSRIKADKETNQILNSISAIKGFSSNVGSVLFECSKNHFDYFMDLINCLYENGIKSAKLESLIKIDYFQDFGDISELLELLNLYETIKDALQGKTGSIKKDKIILKPFVDVFSANCSYFTKSGTESSSYKFNNNVIDILRECENSLRQYNLQPCSIKKRIDYSMEILGYTDIITNKECDRKRLLITDDAPLIDKNGNTWAYRLGTKSLGSGKTARVSIDLESYKNNPIHKGDVVFVESLWKNNKGYWYLKKYIKE